MRTPHPYLPLLETGGLVEEHEIGLLGWGGGLLYGDQPDTGAGLSIWNNVR